MKQTNLLAKQRARASRERNRGRIIEKDARRKGSSNSMVELFSLACMNQPVKLSDFRDSFERKREEAGRDFGDWETIAKS